MQLMCPFTKPASCVGGTSSHSARLINNPYNTAPAHHQKVSSVLPNYQNSSMPKQTLPPTTEASMAHSEPHRTIEDSCNSGELLAQDNHGGSEVEYVQEFFEPPRTHEIRDDQSIPTEDQEHRIIETSVEQTPQGATRQPRADSPAHNTVNGEAHRTQHEPISDMRQESLEMPLLNGPRSASGLQPHSSSASSQSYNHLINGFRPPTPDQQEPPAELEDACPTFRYHHFGLQETHPTYGYHHWGLSLDNSSIPRNVQPTTTTTTTTIAQRAQLQSQISSSAVAAAASPNMIPLDLGDTPSIGQVPPPQSSSLSSSSSSSTSSNLSVSMGPVLVDNNSNSRSRQHSTLNDAATTQPISSSSSTQNNCPHSQAPAPTPAPAPAPGSHMREPMRFDHPPTVTFRERSLSVSSEAARPRRVGTADSSREGNGGTVLLHDEPERLSRNAGVATSSGGSRSASAFGLLRNGSRSGEYEADDES